MKSLQRYGFSWVPFGTDDELETQKYQKQREQERKYQEDEDKRDGEKSNTCLPIYRSHLINRSFSNW